MNESKCGIHTEQNNTEALKKNDILPYETWMDLKNIMFSEIIQR